MTPTKGTQIPIEHRARLGEVGGLIVEWDEDYKRRPEHPAQKAARIEQEVTEANRIRIHLSTRGWGDYASVAWEGDRRLPTDQIVAACQKLLRDGHDVDQPDQSDEEIAAKVTEAKRKSIEQDAARDASTRELAATDVPAAAISAYDACGGDPDNFEDNIDDPRYWLVRRYAAAIEHQGLAKDVTMRKLARDLRTATAEQPTDA